eukprot:COSAG05_NODE_1245_length_5413_cov_6.208129_1_plen_94_part_00
MSYWASGKETKGKLVKFPWPRGLISAGQKKMVIQGLTNVVPKLEALKQDAKNRKVNTRSPEFAKLRNLIIDTYAHLFQNEDGTRLTRHQITNR